MCPPCTAAQAAALAEAALCDTLAAVAATPAARRVLVLVGEPGAWLPPAIEVVAQRGGGLAERLAFAFADAADGAPALLVGMDTPQLTPRLLELGLDALRNGARSVLGLAADGGYWAIGLQRPDPAVFAGVPMSSSRTGAAQYERLRRLGLDPAALPILRDVDRIADAMQVAALAPDGRFAVAVDAMTSELAAV